MYLHLFAVVLVPLLSSIWCFSCVYYFCVFVVVVVVYLFTVVPLGTVQMKEIEEECGKLPSTVAVPSRLLRSEQKKQAMVSASAVGGGEDEEEGEEGEEGVGGTSVPVRVSVTACICDSTTLSPPSPHSPSPLSPSPLSSSPLSAVQVEAIDPYDLLDPVDMLAQMPKDFYDNIVRLQPSLVD